MAESPQGYAQGTEQLFSQPLHDTVVRSGLYHDVNELLKQPDVHAAKIGEDIKQLRKAVAEDVRFSFLRIPICTTATDLQKEKATMLEEHERMKGESDGFSYGRYDMSYEFPDYSTVTPVDIKTLYHWTDVKNVDEIQHKGLLPGFIAGGRNTRGFVHTTVTFDEHWPQKVAKEMKTPYDPKAFAAYEITYDPSLEAYMWLQLIYHHTNGNPPLLTSHHSAEQPGLSPLVSSQAVPLALQVGELVQYDRELVQKAQTDRSGWRYSSLLGMELPPYATSLPEHYSTSEVLLDYVPPIRIKRITP